MPKTFTVPELCAIIANNSHADPAEGAKYYEAAGDFSYSCGWIDAIIAILKALHKANEEDINEHAP